MLYQSHAPLLLVFSFGGRKNRWILFQFEKMARYTKKWRATQPYLQCALNIFLSLIDDGSMIDPPFQTATKVQY